jgi:hypothetical protein
MRLTMADDDVRTVKAAAGERARDDSAARRGHGVLEEAAAVSAGTRDAALKGSVLSWRGPRVLFVPSYFAVVARAPRIAAAGDHGGLAMGGQGLYVLTSGGAGV